jgi:hypothetical protein
MKRLSFIIVLIVAASASPAWAIFAHADSPTTASSTTSAPPDSACGVTSDDLAAIQAIQNNSTLSYLDELHQELTARKQLLTKIILCAKTDAEGQKADLSSAVVDPNFQNLKSQWLNKLDDAITYYDLQLGKVDSAGISGTESIARDVLAWRGNNYAPLSENVSDFIIWSGNQTLFGAADSRLAQIKNLVSSPLFSENLDVQNDFGEAAVSLTAAEDENNSAKSAFAQSLPPDQPLFFIKQSLDSLSSTYQHFFDVSTLIQSLLPQ